MKLADGPLLGLVGFMHFGNHAMEAITWRISCKFTKFQAIDVHLG
jgi:hypothetical protein